MSSHFSHWIFVFPSLTLTILLYIVFSPQTKPGIHYMKKYASPKNSRYIQLSDIRSIGRQVLDTLKFLQSKGYPFGMVFCNTALQLFLLENIWNISLNEVLWLIKGFFINNLNKFNYCVKKIFLALATFEFFSLALVQFIAFLVLAPFECIFWHCCLSFWHMKIFLFQ